VRKVDLQPNTDAVPKQVVVDETVICVNGSRHWLYAAVDQESNQLLRVRLFQTGTTQLSLLVLHELRDR